MVADVLFPVAPSGQADLFHDTEQLRSKHGGVLHANTPIIVLDETLGHVALERFLEQQAIGRHLIHVAVMRAAGSRTVSGLDLDWHNSVQNTDHICPSARIAQK